MSFPTENPTITVECAVFMHDTVEVDLPDCYTPEDVKGTSMRHNKLTIHMVDGSYHHVDVAPNYDSGSVDYKFPVTRLVGEDGFAIPSWQSIADSDVVAIWRDSDGNEVRFPPTFYSERGTPIDGNGNDMVYVRTEIRGNLM